jgi:hypothetical protein
VLKTKKHSIPTHPDVLVVGGGSAGVAAAVAAAGAGASVVLLEKNAYPGGKATAAYVGTVCGLYYRSEDPVARYVSDGFSRHFAEQLQAASGTAPYFYKNGLHFLPYRRFAFIQVCDGLLQKNKVTSCFHGHLTQVKKEGDCIVEASAFIHNRPIVFYPKTIIDTAGEAVVSRLAGLDIFEDEAYQASAQVFCMAGIGTDDAQVLGLSLLRCIQKGISDGIYPKEYERLSVVPGSLKAGRAAFKLGLPLALDNDPAQVAHLEWFARKAVGSIEVFLRAKNDLFKNAWLTMVAPEVGIRTGPRNVGQVVLQKEDVMSCRKAGDAVARGAWPIEYWPPGQNPRMEYFALDDYYDIPAGALRSAFLKNLFFAGRNISASEEAVASARVIGTCLEMGFAAGRMAVK